MANWYVDSAATGANDGTSKTDAWTSITSAPAGIAAGDTVFVSHTHSQDTSFSTLTWPDNTRVISLNFGTDAYQKGALVNNTFSSYTISSNLSNRVFFNGMDFRIGGGSTRILTLGKGRVVFVDCDIRLLGTGTCLSTAVDTAGARILLKSCSIYAGSAVTQIFSASNGSVRVTGGAVIDAPAISLFINAQSGVDFKADNFDMSVLPSTVNLAAGSNVNAICVFTNCRTPTSWTGAPNSSALAQAQNVSMFNCDNADTNYKLWIEGYAGSIRDETTLVRTGGATDGTTAIAWKMVSNANANEPLSRLVSPEMAIWNETTGASKTVTVEILHDSSTALTDAEIWLEVDYLGTSGVPLGVRASDQRATIMTTPADQASSSATWTTTGMSNPNKQKLEVTFTPQEKGFFVGRVALAATSKTVYVDPELAVS